MERPTAIVLGGGGARAAYQVGALHAIAELVPLAAARCPFPSSAARRPAPSTPQRSRFMPTISGAESRGSHGGGGASALRMCIAPTLDRCRATAHSFSPRCSPARAYRRVLPHCSTTRRCSELSCSSNSNGPASASASAKAPCARSRSMPRKLFDRVLSRLLSKARRTSSPGGACAEAAVAPRSRTIICSPAPPSHSCSPRRASRTTGTWTGPCARSRRSPPR